jgi:cytoplasmic iron level regulating protein YaaA (DUF328/UPF0246 family)
MIYFIACSKSKIKRDNIPASELYSKSPLFRKSYNYAKKRGQVYIISSLYGIIKPDTKINYYERTVNKMSKEDFIELKKKVQYQLKQFNITGQVVSLMGKKYNLLIDNLNIITPLKGLGIGKRLKALTE